jgi:curved DNA-binding protein CbpA
MTPPLSVQKLKLRCRRRALRHHPDRGGDAACMAAINLAFDRLLGKLKGE